MSTEGSTVLLLPSLAIDKRTAARESRESVLDPDTFKPTVENTRRLIHPEDLPHVEEVLETAIRERRAFEVDYRMIRPDGSTRRHHGLGRPIDNESGELEFIGTVEKRERL